jgi:FlaA1/EpsC-like NDP-sugar epimerase/lipopolysaccharide/colanic/teichoic acid biosynthesis glycosyltransferase
MTRLVDLVVATVVLVVVSPVLALCATVVKLSSPGPVIHVSDRVGRAGNVFHLYKLRTMVSGEPGPAVTAKDDPRITRVGGFLRRTRLDELPQLINVLRGDMALVGPRPEDPHFVELYNAEQREVLSVRPGITGPTALAYHGESELLTGADPESTYLSELMPRKLQLDLEYLRTRTVLGDLAIIVRTVAVVVGLRSWYSAAAWIRRRLPWLAIDVVVVAAGFYAAYLLRFVDTGVPRGVENPGTLTLALVPIAAVFAGFNRAFRLGRREWRYATAADVRVIALAASLSTLAVVIADALLGVHRERPVPLGVVLVGSFFTFSGFVVSRYWSRLVIGFRAPAAADRLRTRTLIFGAGDAGQSLAYRLMRESQSQNYDVVGFVDDDRAKTGRIIHGIPVVGTRDNLQHLVTNLEIDMIVLSMNNIAGTDVRDILTLALQTPARIKIVPGLHEALSDRQDAPLRELRAQDLLGRAPVYMDEVGVRNVMANRVVLVTGACGSIGSELSRHILAFDPEQLVALDNNESGLYDLEIELRTAAPSARLQVVVADVTDAQRIEEIFELYHPDVIFHVAAYKHVPLMEKFPQEALRVNVFGTWTILQAARRHGSAEFVLVSTDKAVNPTSIMGCTKRISELLVCGAPRPQGRPVTAAVRFGNVLGTRGSVVPTFSRQIDLGGPLTVTHPDMTRFFMDVGEAASLIIQAAALTTGGDVFMLDMGDSIRVDDLARKMIRMRGLRPDVDVRIVYTGIRAGEKLHEELVHSVEEKSATGHPQIYRVDGGSSLNPAEASGLIQDVEQLLAPGIQHAELVEGIHALANRAWAATGGSGGRRAPRSAPAPSASVSGTRSRKPAKSSPRRAG